jgi:undecaprenyl-diphosphatase
VDWSLLHTLNDFMAGHDGFEDTLLFYVEASELLFVVILAIVFLLAGGPRFRDWRRATVAAVLSAGFALMIGKVISELVDRARPFVADPHGVHLFSPHVADPGFPSDHATAAFAIAVAILLRKRGGGAAALVAATVLALGRVALGIHFPSDVLGGAVLGAAVAVVFWWSPIRARIDALTVALAAAPG